jgi:hypothetical protein
MFIGHALNDNRALKMKTDTKSKMTISLDSNSAKRIFFNIKKYPNHLVALLVTSPKSYSSL